jgi:amidase
MISLAEYSSRDGLGLAELVARKEVMSRELVEVALAAIEKVNPRLNAVLQTLTDRAHAEIRKGLPQRAFAGVPFLIKELVLLAKDVRCDQGSGLAQGFVPSANTDLMARLRRASLVLMGTTQSGLPIGVQLVARFGDEATLIRVASQLEQARPWQERKPPGHASK